MCGYSAYDWNTIAIPRFAAGVSLTRSPSMRNSPSLISSSPAIMRSSVDLPQPDGPTKTTNSPSAMSMSAPWTTSKLPKRLTTLVRVTAAILLLLDRAGGDAGDEMALQQHEDDEHRHGQHHRARHDAAPGHLGEADQRAERNRRRHRAGLAVDQQRPQIIVP